MFFWESDFVPGRPGTEVFVPGHLLLPLSRDKGTPGQEIFLVPGQRDNRTSSPGFSRDVLRDVPSHGNTNSSHGVTLLCLSFPFYCSFMAVKAHAIIVFYSSVFVCGSPSLGYKDGGKKF